MNAQSNCLTEQSEQQLVSKLDRLCTVIEAQTKAITELAIATNQMQSSMVELQGELAAHMLDDDIEELDGPVYLDDTPSLD